jgi:hypothetical protein
LFSFAVSTMVMMVAAFSAPQAPEFTTGQARGKAKRPAMTKVDRNRQIRR